MMTRIIASAAMAAAAALAAPALGQVQPQQIDPDEGVQTYNYPQQPGYGYGQPYNYGQQNSYYQFDQGLLTAVNTCAYRAAQSNLSRVVVGEVDRTTSNRYQVAGWAEWYPYQQRNYPYGYGTPQNQQNQQDYGYNYGYRSYTVSFTCTADSWGRVLDWSTRRR